MRWLLPVMLLGVLAGAISCGGTEHTEVLVTIRAPETALSSAESVHVRVWDDDGFLVSDDFVPVASVRFPIALPIGARDDDGSRRYHAEAELFTVDDCAFGRAVVAGQFEPGVSLRREVTMTGAPGACQAVYVGPLGTDAEDGACLDPSTPCRSLQYTFDRYMRSGMADVMYVDGGGTYAGFVANEPDAPLPPLIFRAWPGTGTPRIDADGESAAAGACCSDSAIDDSEWDGFELTGAAGYGFQFNGPNASGNTLRNAYVHDNGIAPSCPPEGCETVDAGVQVNNEASDNIIEFCVVSNNRSDDLRGDGTTPIDARGIWMNTSVSGNVVRYNRIHDNESSGIDFSGGDGGGALIGNIIRGNGGSGVRGNWGTAPRIADNAVLDNGGHGFDGALRSAVVENNTILRNGGDEMVVRGGSDGARLRNNIVAFNEGAGLRDDGTSGATQNSHNLTFDNADGDRIDLESDDPATDLDEDPRLRHLRPVDVALTPESPALGAGEGGADLGAEPLTVVGP